MESKTALDMYREEKCGIRKKNLYDNSNGSALLFEARAGCLRTKSFLRKYTQNEEISVVGRKETETIGYLVLECDSTHPNPREGNVRFPGALGFTGNKQEVNYKAVEVTKRRLEYWRRKIKGLIKRNNLLWKKCNLLKPAANI